MIPRDPAAGPPEVWPTAGRPLRVQAEAQGIWTGAQGPSDPTDDVQKHWKSQDGRLLIPENDGNAAIS